MVSRPETNPARLLHISLLQCSPITRRWRECFNKSVPEVTGTSSSLEIRLALVQRPTLEGLGIQVVTRKNEEILEVQKKMIELGGRSLTTSSEDVLFEAELEDMCEQDPSAWEQVANDQCASAWGSPGETRDSTTGETLDPAKVEERVPGGNEVYVPDARLGSGDPRRGKETPRGENPRHSVGHR